MYETSLMYECDRKKGAPFRKAPSPMVLPIVLYSFT